MEILDVGLAGRRRVELEKHARKLAQLRGEKYVDPDAASGSDMVLGLVMWGVAALVLVGVVALVIAFASPSPSRPAYSAPISDAPWRAWKAEHDRDLRALNLHDDGKKIAEWYRAHPEPPRPGFQ